jgi:hypothetical protein
MPRGHRKGTPKTGGRKKGSPNKSTRSVKEAIELAFLGIGGVDQLIKWAKKHPSEFFSRVWVRILPQQIQLDLAGIDGKPPAVIVYLPEKRPVIEGNPESANASDTTPNQTA